MEESIVLEKEEPTTSNEDTLDDYRRHYRAMYMEARRVHLPSPPEDLSRAELVQLLKRMDKEYLLPPIPVDETNSAIEIMAEVRAYYECEPSSCSKPRLLTNLPRLVAFRRFIDNIPRIIDFELLKGFSRTIGVGSKLFEDVVRGKDDIHECCTAFLKEDPEILLSRKSLKQELDKLVAALESLEAISAVNLGPGSETDEVLAARLDGLPIHSPGTPLSQPSSPPSQADSSVGGPTSPPALSRPGSPLLAQNSPVFPSEEPISPSPFSF
jgi:Dynamin GTPase effector domain